MYFTIPGEAALRYTSAIGDRSPCSMTPSDATPSEQRNADASGIPTKGSQCSHSSDSLARDARRAGHVRSRSSDRVRRRKRTKADRTPSIAQVIRALLRAPGVLPAEIGTANHARVSLQHDPAVDAQPPARSVRKLPTCRKRSITQIC
jgi:hypothetical protein